MELLTSPIAAVVHETRAAAIDRLMLEAAKRLRARGVRLGGLVQHNVAKQATDCAAMLLEDLASGKLVTISLERSRRGSGCRLDAAGLAEAAALGGRGIASGVDLAIISKFGAQEAAGKGLRAELAQAVMLETPLLTSVSSRLLSTFEDFVGESWTRLPPELAAIETWALSAVDREPALDRAFGA
jgi:nucleoside-triphosphatase THEP1